MSGYVYEDQLKVTTGLPCSDLTWVKTAVRKTTLQQTPRVCLKDRWNKPAQLSGHLAHRDFNCKQHHVLPHARNWGEFPRADLLPVSPSAHLSIILPCTLMQPLQPSTVHAQSLFFLCLYVFLIFLPFYISCFVWSLHPFDMLAALNNPSPL